MKLERQEQGEEEQKKAEGLADIYDAIEKKSDLNTAKIMYELFKGQQVTFPVRFYASDYVAESVKKEYQNGRTIKELAEIYGYTERRIRQFVKGDL